MPPKASSFCYFFLTNQEKVGPAGRRQSYMLDRGKQEDTEGNQKNEGRGRTQFAPTIDKRNRKAKAASAKDKQNCKTYTKHPPPAGGTLFAKKGRGHGRSKRRPYKGQGNKKQKARGGTRFSKENRG